MSIEKTRSSDVRAVPAAHEDILQNTDEEVLASLGYKQEFKREFSRLEVFGLGFSIIGIVPSVASTLLFALPNGGPSAMIWGWLACSVFLMFIALSIAELASSAPTSGGLYYWTFKYSSPRWRNLLSWIVGYSNTIVGFSAVASVDWGCAVQIMAAASIGSNLTGLFCGLVISHAVFCSLGTNIIARLQTPYIMLNILLCLAIIIGVPAMTPSEFRNPPKFAFGGFENMLGWSNGYSFILSFLYPLWCIGGFDSTVHMSEEATNARVAVPWAIVFSTGLGCVLGWGINIALAFCMGPDVGLLMNSPIQQPMAAILYQSFGQKGTLVIWSFIVILQYMMGANILASYSRQTFAFSRDGALPLSRWLYYVHPRLKTPIHCVWFTALFGILLGLLAFAGIGAISAIFSLAVACQYVVYSIPVSARYLGRYEFKRGPFHLGKMSRPIATFAVLWMAFNIVICLFPASPKPNAAGMNYSVVVLGGTILLALSYYYLPTYGGRYWFNGPVRNVSAKSDSDRRSSTVKGCGIDDEEKSSAQ